MLDGPSGHSRHPFGRPTEVRDQVETLRNHDPGFRRVELIGTIVVAARPGHEFNGHHDKLRGR